MMNGAQVSYPSEIVNETNATKRERLENLVARLTASKLDAADDYHEFARYFGPRFKSLFRRRGLSPVESDDLAETCITDILLKLDKYQVTADGSFEAWVFTIARRTLVDFCHKRLPLVHPTPTSTQSLKPQIVQRLVVKTAPDPNVTAAVNELLAQLSETDRKLIELRDFISDNSFDEVARELGTTPGAARTRHCRLLKRLQAALEQDPRMRKWIERGQGKSNGKES